MMVFVRVGSSESTEGKSPLVMEQGETLNLISFDRSGNCCLSFLKRLGKFFFEGCKQWFSCRRAERFSRLGEEEEWRQERQSEQMRESGHGVDSGWQWLVSLPGLLYQLRFVCVETALRRAQMPSIAVVRRSPFYFWKVLQPPRDKMVLKDVKLIRVTETERLTDAKRSSSFSSDSPK